MKCLVLYAPHAIKGRVEENKQKIKAALEQRFEVVDFAKSEYPGHVSVLASEACGVYECVVALGGDGTLHEVVNGVAQKQNRPIIGVLPCGTVNDVARSLGISKKLDKALKVVVEGVPFTHDIFKANDKYGIYVFGGGLFTSSSYKTKQKVKQKFGWLAYLVNGAKELFRKNKMQLKITLADKKVVEGDFALMLMVNSNSVAGFRLNKGALLDDGKIDVVLIKQSKVPILGNFVSLFRLLKIVLLKLKRIKTRGGIIRFSASSLKLENSDLIPLNLDGEGADMEKVVHFDMLPKHIKILAPNKFVKK